MRASDLEIPEPCAENWDEMTVQERGRHCAVCRQTVHDLSTMTEAQARALLDEDADICISYEQVGGDVVLRPQPLIPPSRLTRLPLVASAGLSVVLAACAPHGEGPSLDERAQEPPAFLEVTPSIPAREAEPCDGPSQAIPEPPEAEPTAHSEIKPKRPSRMKGRLPRKTGKRAPPKPRTDP